jgi:hypothetical protein
MGPSAVNRWAAAHVGFCSEFAIVMRKRAAALLHLTSWFGWFRNTDRGKMLLPLASHS